MSAIVIPDLLGRFIITTLTFEELASLDGKELDGYAGMITRLGGNRNRKNSGENRKRKCCLGVLFSY